MTAAGTGRWYNVPYGNLPACQGLRAELIANHHERRFAMSLSKTFPIVEVSAIGR